MSSAVCVNNLDDVRAAFRERGISVRHWARANGVSVQLTYKILAGRQAGLRGQSHDIAVMLGLKEGVVDSNRELSFVRAESAEKREQGNRRPQKGA